MTLILKSVELFYGLQLLNRTEMTDRSDSFILLLKSPSYDLFFCVMIYLSISRECSVLVSNLCVRVQITYYNFFMN